jgi:hypothetical protein
VTLQPKSGLDSLFLRSLYYIQLDTHTHTNTVELLCTRDQTLAETAIYTTHQEQHKRRTSMPSAGIRTHDPSKKAAADYALDCTDTGLAKSVTATWKQHWSGKKSVQCLNMK